MKFSIIIPMLNEAPQIERLLKSLQNYRAQGHEIIVVDGGSCDESIAKAKGWVDGLLEVEDPVRDRGRAVQMNRGAEMATGDVLLFLHCDTFLPSQALLSLEKLFVTRQAAAWGRFDIELSGRRKIFRVIESAINCRSRWSGIATGDQAIFVRANTFAAIGGYQRVPLMEDVDLCKRLKRVVGSPINSRLKVSTSSRRWETHGVYKTILLMWCLRFAFFVGVNPSRIAAFYR